MMKILTRLTTSERNDHRFFPTLHKTFPFDLHGPLKTCPRIPTGFMDPGLRNPALKDYKLLVPV